MYHTERILKGLAVITIFLIAVACIAMILGFPVILAIALDNNYWYFCYTFHILIIAYIIPE